jgi:hypothetical protein
MIQLAAVIIIEDKYLTGRRVLNRGTWTACGAFVDRRKDSVAVIPENGNNAFIEPIKREMVLSAAVVIVEGDDAVSGGLESELPEALASVEELKVPREFFIKKITPWRPGR